MDFDEGNSTFASKSVSTKNNADHGVGLVKSTKAPEKKTAITPIILTTLVSLSLLVLLNMKKLLKE